LAGADGWVEFAEKVSRIPELNNMKGLPHGQKVEKFSKFGIRWQGKPVSKSAIGGIWVVASYAAIGTVRASIRDFNSVSSCLAEPTKISRLCQLVDTWFSKHDRSTAALIYIIESLNLALFYKDVSESEVTVSCYVRFFSCVCVCFPSRLLTRTWC
jgi:hypothetical protein